MYDPLVKRVRHIVETFDVSQTCYSALAQVDGGIFSKFLAGQVALPKKSQERVRRVAHFIETIGTASRPFPLCFHSPEKLKPIWDAFPHDESKSTAA